MTNKIQYSKKFSDGSIVVVGGDTVDEWDINMEQFRLSKVAQKLFEDIKAVKSVAKDNKPQQQNGEVETVTLPEDAVLEVIHKGEKRYGEIAPFPGTKYPVKVWSEVLDTIDESMLGSGLCNVGGWEVKFARNDKGYPMKVTDFLI